VRCLVPDPFRDVPALGGHEVHSGPTFSRRCFVSPHHSDVKHCFAAPGLGEHFADAGFVATVLKFQPRMVQCKVDSKRLAVVCGREAIWRPHRWGAAWNPESDAAAEGFASVPAIAPTAVRTATPAVPTATTAAISTCSTAAGAVVVSTPSCASACHRNFRGCEEGLLSNESER